MVCFFVAHALVQEAFGIQNHDSASIVRACRMCMELCCCNIPFLHGSQLKLAVFNTVFRAWPLKHMAFPPTVLGSLINVTILIHEGGKVDRLNQLEPKYVCDTGSCLLCWAYPGRTSKR